VSTHRIGILVLLAALALPSAVLPDDSGSPHTSTEMCDVCHNSDMTLQRSKGETCTLCHATTQHSGSAEHLRIEPARVGRAMAADAAGAKLPLTDDGHIWCGTCHLWHDPSLGEAWLPMGWVPPDRDLPGAVRAGITARWGDIARAHDQKTVGAQFATQGTRQLRLPVQDGSLCKRCHGGMP
jgi:hypothetical protein